MHSAVKSDILGKCVQVFITDMREDVDRNYCLLNDFLWEVQWPHG